MGAYILLYPRVQVKMLIFFGFTNCPEICPTALQVATAALDKLGPKGWVYAHAPGDDLGVLRAEIEDDDLFFGDVHGLGE